jgi:purine-binding chemotaxis protein CheW
MSATLESEMQVRARGGLHLTFKLGEEAYGIEILKVQEIMGMLTVTPVPRTPDYMRGVINLRGKVIPVIDLRLKFAMDAHEYTRRTCIIVVQVQRERAALIMGIIVDEVSEVLDVSTEQIEPPPSFGTEVNTEFILGIGKVGSKVMMLLDVDRVLTGEELKEVTQAA